jgi:hypothetical protein
MPLNVQAVIDQIDQTLAEYQELKTRARHDDYSDQPDPDVARVAARLSSSIERLAPAASYFKQNLQEISAANKGNYPGFKIDALVGILSALKREYELGHFQFFAELIHADTAVSFIEMAEDLHGQGYKDAAAVIAGSVLEQHLRDLCPKNQISTVQASGKYKKADSLNSDLATNTVYSKLDQKNVTSWLGLRNEAAHGNYSSYTEQQVVLMIQAIQEFMARHPA